MTYILKENLIKKGEQLLVISAKNDMSLQGALVEMVSADNNRQSFQVKIMAEGDATNPKAIGSVVNLYNSGPADEYIRADKEGKLKHYKEKLVELEVKKATVLAEIDFIEKYDSMEEFVADKIGLLIQANTKESRVEILKTLKQTNYL